MPEAKMKINGVELSPGQASTVRVALTDLLQAMSDSNALGSDAHGRAMTKAYFDHASDVLEIINT